MKCCWSQFSSFHMFTWLRYHVSHCGRTYCGKHTPTHTDFSYVACYLCHIVTILSRFQKKHPNRVLTSSDFISADLNDVGVFCQSNNERGKWRQLDLPLDAAMLCGCAWAALQQMTQAAWTDEYVSSKMETPRLQEAPESDLQPWAANTHIHTQYTMWHMKQCIETCTIIDNK